MLTPLDHAVSVADAMPDAPGGTEFLAKACGVSRQFFNRMRREYRASGVAPSALRDHAPAIEGALAGAVRVETLYPLVRWNRDQSGNVVGYSVSLSRIPCALPAANDDTAPAEGMGAGEGSG